MLKSKTLEDNVLQSEIKWFKVTYREGNPIIEKTIDQLKAEIIYLQKQWN